MTNRTFDDRFSSRADEYARYRPTYPRALFDYLADLSPSRECAVDCGTGNGQAALGLAGNFDRVIATDASEAQLDRAAKHPRVEYRVAPAEQLPLPDAGADILTVAQALHWFDLPRFFVEATRVLKPRGLLAVWCYELIRASPPIEEVLHRFYHETVGPYWPPNRKLVEAGYAGITLPFAEVPRSREFAMGANWELEHLLGYASSWSAVMEYQKANQRDPVALLRAELTLVWENPNNREAIAWPLSLRVARKE